MQITHLMPQCAQKSFNGKAIVLVTNSNSIFLRSYDTTVAEITPDKNIKIYGEFSRTTIRHIRAFLLQYISPDFDVSIENIRRIIRETTQDTNNKG